MSCNTCGSTTAGCGCKDTSYTTPMVTTCVPACPPKCAEYISATCVLMQDGIDELGSNPGDTIESIIQRLTLIITNPLCVDWNPGSGGGGGGGGGIIQVGLVAPSNLFDTPIVPVTTPGGDLVLSLNDQPSNTVFAGPVSGPDDTPQFRALVVDDLPDLTTGDCVLRGDGAGKFACVTIGPNLSYSGGVLDANVNVVIGAENGLTKDPLNTDTVWLGGPLSNPGVLDFNTFIDSGVFTLKISGDGPVAKGWNFHVENTSPGGNGAILAQSPQAEALTTTTDDGYGVYSVASNTGIALYAESTSGEALLAFSSLGSGIYSQSALENTLSVFSTTPPDDATISKVLTIRKESNVTSGPGLGASLAFDLMNTSDVNINTGSVTSVYTNSGAGSEIADLEFSTIGAGVLETVGRFIGDSGPTNGQFQLNKYGINTFSTGTPLYGLAVDVDGKVWEVPLATGLGTVDSGLRLNPSLSSEAWLGGTLLDDTTITVPDATLFEISGTTITASESVLEINNTAGATGTRALSVSSGGLEPAVHVTQDTTATSSSVKVINDSTNASAYGLDVETKSLPIWARTTQSANTSQVQLLKLHNQTGGSGGNGVGGYISLNAATVSNSDQEAARIGFQYTDATSATRKAQLEFYTANGAVPAQRMTIKETGQVQLNNYTTSTSFPGTSIGLIGHEASGNLITLGSIVASQGLKINPSNPLDVQLGSSADDLTATFTNERYISSGSSGRLQITGTRLDGFGRGILHIDNQGTDPLGSNVALSGFSTGRGISGFSSGSGPFAAGVVAAATNGYGLDASSTNGTALRSIATNSTSMFVQSSSAVGNSTPQEIAYFYKTMNNGTFVTAGGGMKFTYDIKAANSAALINAHEIRHIWSNATLGSQLSEYQIWGNNLGSLQQQFTLKGTGQLQLNKYISATSFTTAVGLSLLGLDTSGNVVNSTGAEGLSFNGLTGNVELGRSALAGTPDFSVSRFINAGTSNLVISGNKSSAGIAVSDVADSAVLRVINTSTTNTTSAIYASIATTANNPSNATIGAAVYALSTGATDDAVAILSRNTSTDFNSVCLKSESSGGVAGRFNTTTQRALIANNTSITVTGGLAPIESQKATTSSTNVISVGFQNTRNPSSTPVPAGGGTSYDFSLNAQGTSGISLETTARMSSYAIDMGITTPGTYASGFKISVQHNSTIPSDRIDFYGANIIKLTQNIPGPYADDTAASAGGVPQYALYRDASSNVKICQI